MEYFYLDQEFINQYKGQQPKWGPIGYVTYKRTYARPKDDGTSEEFWETAKRVVEGTFTIQKNHYKKNIQEWPSQLKKRQAEEMYNRIWEFKFTPPGRGLWMMGTEYVFKRGGAALNNCAFVSTENLDKEFAEPFCFLMDMSMLGVGVGGDTKGRGRVNIVQPTRTSDTHIIPDTREGWVDLARRIINAYFGKATLPGAIDYSQVRPFGAKIKGFGGVSSGPQPLIDLVDNIHKTLSPRIGHPINSTEIVDLFNFVGKCVVSGNVRRSAEIMFGDPSDTEFLNLKNPDIHQDELYDRRWASNNSIFATVGMDYTTVAAMTAKNGEPGYEWLDNAKQFSRMRDSERDYKDYRAAGGNPCLEQTLEPYELCCLVETYPSKHDSLEDWLLTLDYALMYAKTVTLVQTHNEKTNAVINRNRRIGVSMSGIVQAFKKFGRRDCFDAFEAGYDQLKDLDESLSEEFAVPESIKLTSVKPSGTVSLLAGVTPGIHYPQSQYYIRNIRIQAGTPLLDVLKDANYPIEKDKYSDNTWVVSFPVKEEFFDRTVEDVSIWEQLENTAQIQHSWADNQVSVTINFKPEEAQDIKHALELYETRLKGVSFLPLRDHGYEQAPYIPIDEKTYHEMKSKVQPLAFEDAVNDQTEKFCDGEACLL